MIKKGGVYSGNWQSLDADVPAIRVKTSQPVVIQNSVIRSRGTLIEVYQSRANVTVRNTYGYALNPEVAGRYPGRFMDVEGFANIVIDNNYLEGTSGIYLYDYEGNHTARQTVKVRRNSALNIDGRISDGNGGWTPCAADPDNYKQFFQINGVRGLVGAEVAWNQIKNLPGQSRVEENINIHGTTGTAKSPFLIHDNYIQGAFPSDDIDARRYSGGGIMLSDNGSSYLRAYNNQIVSTGHVGVTITSGHDNYFYSNRIISSGLNADGSPIPWSNVGGVVWNFNNESTFKNNGGYKNLIGWVNSSGQRNDSWTPDASRWDKNRAWPGAVTLSTETAEWNFWLKKLARVQIKVGSKYLPK